MPRPPRKSARTTESLLEELVGRIDGRSGNAPDPDVVATGFPSLDRMLAGGLRRQDMVVLAGDVGSGKSALALGIAVRAAGAGVPTLFLSGEMGPGRILERALALEGRASIDQLRQGRLDDAARAAVGGAAVKLRHIPLLVRQLPGEDFDEIRTALDIVPRRRLLIIDSLQLMAPPHHGTRYAERLAASSRALKRLALELDVVVLVVAQLPRHQAQRPDQRPTLDDLGAFGTIKQNADLILLLYREEMYRPGQGVEGATELIVAKNRNGPVGFVDLFFYPQWLRFVDMLDQD